jgi:hypothetical protein
MSELNQSVTLEIRTRKIEGQMRKRNVGIVILLSLASIIGIYFYTNSNKVEIKTYLTATAGPEKIESSVSTTGTVVDEFTFNINSDSPATLTKIAGVPTVSSGTPISLSDTWLVNKINNDEGKNVAKGATIVTLKNLDGTTQLIKSPAKARVRAVNAVVGSPINGTVATVGTGRILISIDVTEVQSTKLSVGLPIALAINSSETLTSGAITSIRSSSTLSAAGKPTYTVLITPTPNTLPLTARAGMTATVEVTPVGSDQIRYTNAILIDEFTYDINIYNKSTLVSKNGVSLVSVIASTPNAGTKQFSVFELVVVPGSVVKKGETIATLVNYEGTKKLVKAPADGTIREVFTTTNALVSGAVVSLGSGQTIAAIKVSEYDILNVGLSQKVALSLGSSEMKSPGIVTQIGQVAAVDANGVSQFTVFAKPDVVSDKWRIGMSVNAKIILKSKNALIGIPIQALQKKGSQVFVQVLDDKKFAVNRNVTIGQTGSQFVEVLSGLSAGDEVVLGIASVDAKLPTSEDPFAEQRSQRNNRGSAK